MGALDGKVVMVTGAGSGIGRATALLLAREGARVGLVGRDEAPLAETADQIDGEGLVLTADISDEPRIRAACDGLAKAWGRIDGVVANAGINGVWAPIAELDLAEWQRTIAINLTGTFLTIKHCLPHVGREGGSVVIMSSVNGTRIFSNVGATAYSCSKAGQVAMAKMLALELAPRRIRVNVICPGKISTAIEASTDPQELDALPKLAVYPQGKIPLTGGRPGRAVDVARVGLFLLSDASAHVSGTEIWVDGAESLLVG
jgi:NAD(P)-dependent dehydrogenase (short-subunit alcohol dehydrogenase family)